MADKKPDPDIFWILDEDGQPVHPESFEELEEFLESDRRALERTYLVGADGDPILVSTVFLTMDHGFRYPRDREDYRPVLWETMVFKGESGWADYDSDRYTSEEAARVGHALIVEKVRRQEQPEVSDAGEGRGEPPGDD